MKNLVKSGLLAIVIAITVTACGDGDKGGKGSKVDTGKTAIDTANKKIDSTKRSTVDTTKKP